MAIETEAKIKLNREEFDKLIKILGKPAFFPQKNTIYKLKEGMFRIREENGKRIITYKGELKKGKFKSLEEVEFKTDSDVDKLKRFFSVLGHKETMFIEKQRANYNYVGCVVSLDILNGNNYFIEIEGKIENIEKCLKKLGLQDKKFEKRSYMEIFQHNNPLI